jgi:hypothetical protein
MNDYKYIMYYITECITDDVRREVMIKNMFKEYFSAEDEHMEIYFKWIFSSNVKTVVSAVKLKNPVTEKEVYAVALWDTGSERSVMTESLAEKLQLSGSGITILNGINGSSVSESAEISFRMPDKQFCNIKADITQNKLSVDFIVGMDIIRKGFFCIVPEIENAFTAAFICPPENIEETFKKMSFRDYRKDIK